MELEACLNSICSHAPPHAEVVKAILGPPDFAWLCLQDMLNLTSCVVQGFLNSVLLYQILVPARVELASKEDSDSEDLQTARARL